MKFCMADSWNCYDFSRPWPFCNAYKSSIQVHWQTLHCSLNSKLWPLETEAVVTNLFPLFSKYQGFGVADMGPGPRNFERMQVHNLQTQRSALNYHVRCLAQETGGEDLLSTVSVKQNVILWRSQKFVVQSKWKSRSMSLQYSNWEAL